MQDGASAVPRRVPGFRLPPPAPALPLAVAERADRLDALRAARRRGTDWLLAHLNADVSMGDPRAGLSTYRAPWTFTVTGETEAAAAMCAWIRRHLVTRDGRIDGPYRVFDRWATYRDATLVVGAAMAQQHDLSLGLWPGLLALRDPGSGLFPQDRLPGGGMADVIDLTAGGPGCGFAALAVGDRAAARGIAAALRRIREAQPEPGRVHFAWSASRAALMTAVDLGFHAPTMVLDPRLDAPQYWFLGGIGAAFLARLWMADPHPDTLAEARWWMALATDATDAQFFYPAACKGSWGAALLWQLTGETAYEAFSWRMADWYLASQEPDGWWHPLGGDDLAGVIEITLEFVMHLDTLIGALASRAPQAFAASQALSGSTERASR